MTYTTDLYKALQFSRQEAERLGNSSVLPEHLLLGIIRLSECKGCELLRALGTDIEALKAQLDATGSGNMAGEPIAIINYNQQSERILQILELETMAYKAEASDTSHLLLAITKEQTNQAAATLRNQYGVTYDAIESIFPKEKKKQEQAKEQSIPRDGGYMDAEGDDEESFSQTGSQSSTSKDDTPALNAYGIDLTRSAEEGKLDPVVGRDVEIERVVQILSRRKKNNPILIGDPGVGKSAIVEGLAKRIVSRQVTPLLLNKRIYTLDIASMVAGTKYRGQFEERMKNILSELQQHSEIILFIDEIHTIIGAGNASGSLDAANILKPALARGDVQCIGATTLNEFRTSIEKDGALERRFQKVIVRPTTKEETYTILKQIAPHYEQHHNVTYTDEALHACVDLTDRYISDRAFPDKAIDAMDEVGARMHVMIPQMPSSINEIEQQLNIIKAEKKQILEQQKFEQAVALRDKEHDLELALQGEVTRWKNSQSSQPAIIQHEDVAKVVSMMSGVPIERVGTVENEQLANMSNTLSQKVIGQDEAVRTIVRAIQRSRVGLKDPNRPIGNFLLIGPTGVGKTFLAQCLAEELFGTRDALIRIDMSEYMEKHAVSLLVGAPPGYIAYEDGGKLTEAVRRKPYSIVLFDEIEKSHPDVFNILLQLMDEGRLTDRQGRVVDFKNTVVIMTSNVGTRQLKDFGLGIGFHDSQEIDPKTADSILRKALNKTFAPEFLNRVDNIVTFNPLSKESVAIILKNEIKKLEMRLPALKISITDEVMNFLVEKGYDQQFGARPMKRAIQTYIEDPITEFILKNSCSIEDILLSLQPETNNIVVSPKTK